MNTLAQQLRAIAARNQRWPNGHDLWPRETRTPWSACRLIHLTYDRYVSSAWQKSREVLRSSRLEAVLFLAREPLTLRKLAHLANLTDGTEARTLLTSIRERHDRRGSAFQVVPVAGGYQLLSRPEFSSWLRPRVARDQPICLSPPALETLAVVAYRQPVLRAEVEAIRGVACGEILRQLLDHDLLRIVGRSEELGRPLWYGTTKRFLQVFGLCSLDQLPWAAQLRRSGGTSGVDSPSVVAEALPGLTTGVDAA
jgi:segregation and condensation protein B